MSDTKTFAQKVWDTLSELDVADHIKQLPKTGKRPPIDYLPWHKAWLLLKRNFPASEYYHDEDAIHKADSVEVEVIIHINSDDQKQKVISGARLAVMDAKFNAILLPDARQINDARQRCLVKALAFAGLGLNLWSDSAVPVGKLDDPINTKQVKIIEDLLKKTGVDEKAFLQFMNAESVETIAREVYEKGKTQLQIKAKS